MVSFNHNAKTAERPLLLPIAGFIDYLRAERIGRRPAETTAIADLLASPEFDLVHARRGLKVLLAAIARNGTGSAHSTKVIGLAAAGSVRRSLRDLHPQNSPQHRPASRPLEATSGAGCQRPRTADGIGGGEAESGGASGRLIAAHTPARGRTDLRHIADAREIAEAEVLAYRLARWMSTRLSRRWRLAHRGRRIDIRRSIRANLGHGSTMLELFRKARPERPVRIIAFVDVSGSMQHYSQFFLQFVKGLVGQWAVLTPTSSTRGWSGSATAMHEKRHQGDDAALAPRRGIPAAAPSSPTALPCSMLAMPSAQSIPAPW